MLLLTKEKEALTLNTVEEKFKAWAQHWICNSFKLLGQSDDCTLERFMPLDLCFYCRGVYRFTLAAHPDTCVCCKLRQSARFSPFELLAVGFTAERKCKDTEAAEKWRLRMSHFPLQVWTELNSLPYFKPYSSLQQLWQFCGLEENALYLA